MGFIKKLLKAEPDRDKAEKLVARGVERARKGDLEGALKLYRDAVRADPTEPTARVNEGLALLDRFNRDKDRLDPYDTRERLREIRSALEDAVDYAPEQLGAHRALLHVRRRLGDFVAAERTARRILELELDDGAGSKALRREVQEALREIEPRARRQEATERATDVALDDDADEDARRAALEQLRPLLGDEETLDRDTLWAAGVLARRLEEDEDAADFFRALLERDPHDVGAHRELADLFARAGNARRALEHSLAAYRADPSDPGLVCNVGVCYLELGELDQAEEYLEIARGLSPDGAIIKRAWAALEARRTG